jgi:polyisoprenoid-binding protein YceI
MLGMKKRYIILMMIIVMGTGILSAQTYYPVDSISYVKVIIRNFGMGIDGRLTGLEGDIHFNTADLKNSSFSVSVDANTINTEINVRDSALRGEQYLDTKMFPRISFLSKLITQPNKGGPFIVKGTLTIKGISKEISFPFTAVPKNDGMFFSGEMKIYRHDFKIAPGSTVLSDNMSVSLIVFAKKG